MAEDLVEGSVAFIDEQVNLYVEGGEAFQSDVVVDFNARFRGQNDQLNEVKFQETLTATESKLRDPAKAVGKKATRILWKVNINKNDNFKTQTVVLDYKVTGKSLTGGVRMVSAPQEKIVIGAIGVTSLPRLTRIMQHEFAKSSGSGFVFDPTPLENHLKTLTVEQKRILFRKAIAVSKETEEQKKHRLIVFITLYPKNDLLMRADHGPSRVRPDATFSVYHCFDLEKGGVTLVCHTQFMLVHLANSLGAGKRDTFNWIKGNQGGKPPNQWLAKNNPKPPEWRLVTTKPVGSNDPDAFTHDGVPWSRVFDLAGQDIMEGNFIHGMVNTHGCWMLFRNYNWPEPIVPKLEISFRKILRKFPRPSQRSDWNRLYDALLADGFTTHPRPATGQDPHASAVMRKFLSFDRNYAYSWFFHEIVGIRYFSNDVKWQVIGGGIRAVNDRNNHHAATVTEDTFPDDQALKTTSKPPDAFPDETGTFAYYDVQHRRNEDNNPKFEAGDDLWKENALGFKTAAGFAPNFGGLTADQLKTRSWADVYFYKEDNLDITTLTARSYLEDP